MGKMPEIFKLWIKKNYVLMNFQAEPCAYLENIFFIFWSQYFNSIKISVCTKLNFTNLSCKLLDTSNIAKSDGELNLS